MDTLDYTIKLDVLSEGYDGKTEWFQPRVGIIPPSTAVITVTRAILSGSDVFTAVRSMHSDDLGQTWSAPVAHDATLGIDRSETARHLSSKHDGAGRGRYLGNDGQCHVNKALCAVSM